MHKINKSSYLETKYLRHKLIIIKTTYRLLLTYYTKTYLYLCSSIQKEKKKKTLIFIFRNDENCKKFRTKYTNKLKREVFWNQSLQMNNFLMMLLGPYFEDFE